MIGIVLEKNEQEYDSWHDYSIKNSTWHFPVLEKHTKYFLECKNI